MPAKSKAKTRKSKDPCAELKRKLKQRDAELKEAREQQAAVSDILRAISATATDVEPALRIIARHAMRLCGSVDARIWLVEGDRAKYFTGCGSIPPAKPGETVALDRGSGIGRVIVDRKAVHIKDAASVSQDEYPVAREVQRRHGHRTMLHVPLMREKQVLGVITLRKMVVEPFTKRQIELVQTFANQAAIAIENVRLFNETKEALEHQTATSEILRIISKSPTDTQPVFDAIVRIGSELLGGMNMSLRLVKGERVKMLASTIALAEDNMVSDDRWPSNWCLQRREVVQVPDIFAEDSALEPFRRRQERRGVRAALFVPLLRENEAIGVISISRPTPGLFTDREIGLLGTFANQAVIAIENVRLFKELQARNAEITEALEQQTATAEILKVISSSPTDTQPVFEAIIDNAMRLCDSPRSGLQLYDGENLRAGAFRGQTPEYAKWLAENPNPPALSSGARSRLIAEQQPIHILDRREWLAYREGDPWAVAITELDGVRTSLAVPMFKEGRLIGAIHVHRREVRAFTQKQIDLISTFADQAVIAIENVRLFKELQARNAEVTESLEQQTVTADILKVISSSPTDTQPVFDAIVSSCLRLFQGSRVLLTLARNDRIENVAVIDATQGDVQTDPPKFYDNRPLNRDTVSGACILDARVIHLPDMNKAVDEFPRLREFSLGHGFLSGLYVPLMREGSAIGAISVRRASTGAYADKEIALLQTFADQAVIAIENVRLFKELQTRNAEITEALEQQTATAEILKVISSSPTDIQPVFDAILDKATRLCDSHLGLLGSYDGEKFQFVAARGINTEITKWIIDRGSYPPHPGGELDRMMRDGQPSHTEDMRQSAGYQSRRPLQVRMVEQGGVRTRLAVPMRKDGRFVGSIHIFRPEVRPFTQKQIDLLSTFADQAVIAIENVRLFKELQSRNAEVTEALEQQTATADILKVIASSPSDVQPVFDAILENACRLGDSQLAAVYRYDGALIHLVATRDWSAEALALVASRFPMPPDPALISGQVVLSGEVVCLEDALADATYDQASAHAGGWRRMLGVPMMREGTPIGVIVVAWREPGPIPERLVTLLKTFADQAVIAIENVRLFNETKEALEQQTATADILRVISSSPTDIQPVFDTILENATRLCDAQMITLGLYDGDFYQTVARRGIPPALAKFQLDRGPHRFSPESSMGRMIYEGQPVHIEDLKKGKGYGDGSNPNLDAFVDLGKARTFLAVPMLKEGRVVGGITVFREDVRPFTQKQIDLVSTFASQAVIAIENVRLFKELQARNAEITETLEQQTATAEILRVISSSPTDTQPVFEAILDNAMRLCDAPWGALQLYDGEHLRRVATRGESPEYAKWLAENPFTHASSSGSRSRMIAEQRPIHILDRREFPGYREGNPLAVALVELNGIRTSLTVPMLKEGRLVGAIFVARREVRAFTQKQIDLIGTFASQAVIAIENVRLFKEIQDKSAQLEIASRHKSEFLASMSHELRTPLNAILGFNEMILGQIYGEVSADMKGPLEDIQSSGKHLLRLINNVLDLAKIEAGRMELALADYSILDTAESVRATLRPLAAEKGLEFVVTVPEDMPLVYGDSGRITQCLVNLAGNSLKFTKAGKVKISVRHHDGMLTCCVSDTGVGIPPDKIGSLFTEFKQTDATIASEYGGTGLGLSITKKFVEMHGGRIWVESEVGKGSRFIFEIPLRVAAQADTGAHA